MLKKDEKVGDYILIEKVGSGGFGEVWKAEKRTSLSVSTFAIKFFRTKDDEDIDLETVIKEVGIWQRLSGLPHIISVIEGNQFKDYVYIVSEFADGGSLDKWLRGHGGKATSYQEAVSIVSQILQGLEGMHNEGFVHRDLKPANVLVKRNILYLADFGISRQMKTHSKTTGTAGTYDYMPPEAFDGKPLVSVHTDIWAAGVLLQKLLTGRMPFPQDELPSLMSAIIMREPENLPETVPVGLKEIIKKALQKKREDRFQSAREMYEALRDPQKFIESQTRAQAETITNKDRETETVVIEPTQDWRAVEAEKARQRQLETAEELKKAEAAQLLQENEAKNQQAEISNIGHGLKSNQKPLNIILTIIAILIGLILLIFLFAMLIKAVYNENFPAKKDGNTNTQQVNNNSNSNLPANTKANTNSTDSNSNLPANTNVASNSYNSNRFSVANNIYNKKPAEYNADDYFFYAQYACLSQDNRYACEIKNYSKAIELDPQFLAAYLKRGDTYFWEKNYQQAIKDYSKAIELSPDRASIYKDRGDAYTKTGQTVLASADYKTYEFLLKKNNSNTNSK